jgi:hypothetical protein
MYSGRRFINGLNESQRSLGEHKGDGTRLMKSQYKLPEQGCLSANCRKGSHASCTMLKCNCKCHQRGE